MHLSKEKKREKTHKMQSKKWHRHSIKSLNVIYSYFSPVFLPLWTRHDHHHHHQQSLKIKNQTSHSIHIKSEIAKKHFTIIAMCEEARKKLLFSTEFAWKHIVHTFMRLWLFFNVFSFLLLLLRLQVNRHRNWPKSTYFYKKMKMNKMDSRSSMAGYKMRMSQWEKEMDKQGKVDREMKFRCTQ